MKNIMNSVQKIARDTAYPETLNPQNILELYEVTQDELQICASATPACNSNSLLVETEEANLLELEAGLLNAAARVKLQGTEDFQNLIDLWEKTSCLEDGEYLRPADRIAMNIFRHLMAAGALKE